MMKTRKPPEMSEFQVKLRRMKRGELAVDPDDRKNLGTRTKLGGEADWIQHDETPKCKACKLRMTFVAQIDSVEHATLKNPFGFDYAARDPAKQGWMFGDVGMIYVFYCFSCALSASVVQQY